MKRATDRTLGILPILVLSAIGSGCASGDSSGSGGGARGAGAAPPQIISASAESGSSPFEQIGTMQHRRIRESSGVVASRRFAGVLWTHNDGKNPAEIFAVSPEGTLLARYRLLAVNRDWEDIDIDDEGRLYIGKFGNNEAQSGGPVEVLRVIEPDPRLTARPRRRLPVERIWRLHYPGDAFDCEALFIRGGRGYLISKHLDGSAAAVYAFDLDGAADQTLAKVADLPIRRPVTGAGLSADGRRLAVLTYGTLYLFEMNGDVAGLSGLEPRAVPTPAGKVEGVCFTPEGIVLTAESREIYRLAAPLQGLTVSVDEAERP